MIEDKSTQKVIRRTRSRGVMAKALVQEEMWFNGFSFSLFLPKQLPAGYFMKLSFE